MRPQILSLIVGSCLLTSCFIDFDNGPFRSCVDGLGDIITAEVPLADFNTIRLSIPAEVEIQQGDEQLVIVEGYENLIDLLERDIRNGEWRIRSRRCIQKRDQLFISITVPDLEEVSVSGEGTIKSTNIIKTDKMLIRVSGSGEVDLGIDAVELDADISGSGDILLEGISEYADYKISGSGELSAFDLISERVDIHIVGSGNSEITVNERLTARIVGSGDIYYRGNPTIDQRVTGSGKVIDAN